MNTLPSIFISRFIAIIYQNSKLHEGNICGMKHATFYEVHRFMFEKLTLLHFILTIIHIPGGIVPRQSQSYREKLATFGRGQPCDL